MSKECDGSIGWGTILSLTINGVLTILSAGLAWKSYKSKSTARHEVEADNIVTFADGRVEKRHVVARIVAEKETEEMTFDLKGKGSASDAGGGVGAIIHKDSKDAEIGPRGTHLKARSVKIALTSAMTAVEHPEEVARKEALVRLAVVTHNPTHAATSDAMQAAAKEVSRRGSVACDAEEIDDGRGVALTSGSAHTKSTMANVAVLAMSQQRGVHGARGNSGDGGIGEAAGGEHIDASGVQEGDMVVTILGADGK